MAETRGAEEEAKVHSPQVGVGERSCEVAWRERGGVIRVNKRWGPSPHEVDTNEEDGEEGNREEAHTHQREERREERREVPGGPVGGESVIWLNEVIQETIYCTVTCMYS